MRRILHLSVLCLVAGAASACSTPDQIVNTPDIPTAGVRFINAVPDTNALDMRFVDIIESNAQYGISFRNSPITSGGVTASSTVEYKNTQAGSRHFRVFLSSTVQAVASTVIKDTTVTITAGKLYTAIMWGTARTGGMKFAFIEENIPDPGTNVGLRVMNATTAAIDARQYPSAGTAPVAATWASVAPLTFTTFVNASPAQVKFNITAAGSATAMFTDGLALIGAAPAVDLEGLPGTTVAGSAVTAIVFPASVVGSNAPQGGVYTTPQLTFMWDKRPPRLSTN
ncbi:MAG: DUF4397 domain-containing protein [bacterium]